LAKRREEKLNGLSAAAITVRGARDDISGREVERTAGSEGAQPFEPRATAYVLHLTFAELVLDGSSKLTLALPNGTKGAMRAFGRPNRVVAETGVECEHSLAKASAGADDDDGLTGLGTRAVDVKEEGGREGEHTIADGLEVVNDGGEGVGKVELMGKSVASNRDASVGEGDGAVGLYRPSGGNAAGVRTLQIALAEKMSNAGGEALRARGSEGVSAELTLSQSGSRGTSGGTATNSAKPHVTAANVPREHRAFSHF